MPVAVGCSSELRTGVLNYVEVCELRSVTCECDSDICELDSVTSSVERGEGSVLWLGASRGSWCRA